MDPLSALSLAGTVIQFIDFGSKLIGTGKELYSKGRLGVHEQAAAATKDLLNYTVKLQRPLRAPGQSILLTENELALESICQECAGLAQSLHLRLQTLELSNHDKSRRWKSFKVAFRSMWTTGELETMKRRLDGHRNQINSRVLQSLR